MGDRVTRSGWIALAAVGVVVLAGLWFVLRGRDDRDAAATDGVRERAPAGAMPGMDMDPGMAMDPAMDAGMGESGTIRLTSDQLRTFGVTFGTAAVRPLEKTIRTVGVVSYDETRMASVTPRFGGYVERLYVNFTGQPVSRGQPLLEVYSPELVSAQEELLLAARLQMHVGESAVEGVAADGADLLAAARRRLRNWDISEDQIRRVLRTGQVQRTLTLHAPVSGIVMEKRVLSGQAIHAGDNLYLIADLSRVWIEAELFEADGGLVQAGMPAAIELAAYPGRTFGGTVEYVAPTLRPDSRSLQARIALPNPGGRLKPGMYATVRLTVPLGAVLTVPRSAVLQTGEQAIAFVAMGGGELMPHELTLGAAAGEHVEVVAGLEPGQRVVTSAQFLLDSESNLAEVMRAMMAQMNAGDR
ncbi:MAG: efflux RND transporter periplasmic adaptor subunit [Gemmatimonadota bacterium]